MKRKSLLGILAIITVGALAFALLARNSRTNSSDVVLAGTPGTTNGAKVVAYYFHGTTRCFTCRKIESLSHEVVTSDFGPQLATDQLEWQSVNIEQPGNEHYFDDYKLVSSSLVLVTYRNGKQTNYTNLTDVWKLVNNEPAFRNYVQSEIKSALQRLQ